MSTNSCIGYFVADFFFFLLTAKNVLTPPKKVGPPKEKYHLKWL